jgi:hypothetical protein
MTATCATVASALLDAAVAVGLGPALEYAIEIANRERLPVLVAFGLMEAAFGTILHLNNKYFLDGHDPNSCANVAWIFGVHHRPWPERPVFGKVRSMTAQGLERKFDMAGYVRAVDELVEAERR